jgi:hypothetical protein
MAFRPLLSIPKPLALAIGAAGFLILYALFNSSLLSSISPSVGGPLFLGIFVLSGGLAGYVAGRSPLMHGAIVGALTGLVAIVYVAVRDGAGFAGVGSFITSVAPVAIYMAIPGIALCSLGAVIGDFMRGRARGL